MPDDNALNTKEKIFRAAVSVFAAKGFAAATVREICSRAGANVAAVNYHFGSKEKLYAEVLDFVFAGSEALPRAAAATPAVGSPEERLAAFVRAFVRSVYQSCEGFDDCELGAVFLHEMANPSPALDHIVDRYIRPDARVLFTLVREMLGPEAPEDLVWGCGGSIVAQVLYHCAIGPITSRLRPAPEGMDMDAFLDGFADHVLRFSLGGIEAARRSLARS
ncbi:MAG: CerR family C-terminal domain-containing protein [Thermodesulfobacteriota bacterium]